VAYGNGLENRRCASNRGFESHPLRHLSSVDPWIHHRPVARRFLTETVVTNMDARPRLNWCDDAGIMRTLVRGGQSACTIREMTR
jgi:hypothetical protein